MTIYETCNITHGPSQFHFMVHLHDDRWGRNNEADFVITTHYDYRHREPEEFKALSRISFAARIDMIRRVVGEDGKWDIEGVAFMPEGLARYFNGSYSTQNRKGWLKFYER